MKSLMQLLCAVLSDAEHACHVSTTRDFQTITSRVEHEGLSFLTISLPRFASDFERSLELGEIRSDLFAGFRKRQGSPVFLRGFLALVFDLKTRRVVERPCVNSILFIRQICLLYKKINVPCSDARIRKTIRGFVDCENELKAREAEILQSPEFLEFGKLSDLIWPTVFSSIEAALDKDFSVLVPKHGPGTTSEGILGNAKYDIKSWTKRLEEAGFRQDMFTLYQGDRACWIPGIVQNDLQYDRPPPLELIEPGAEQPVRVVTVPKTLKAPRIIAIEPVCMQYTQQSILEILVPSIEKAAFTRGSVNFTDQSINKRAALENSSSRRQVTMDLSEASDRVLNSVVERMLRGTPNLRKAVSATRSTTADVPGFGIMPLTKFASMGSALCFPMEACVFYTLAIMAWHRAHAVEYSSRSILRAKRSVRIYGDDIIIDVDMADFTQSFLEALGLKVNELKTFSRSQFRESCGMDAFAGYAVNPVYARQMPPLRKTDSRSLISWIELSNNLHLAGHWRSAQYILEHVEGILRCKLPLVRSDSSVHGWLHYSNSYTVSAWNPMLHCFKQFGIKIRTKYRRENANTGWRYLLKFFLKRGQDPYSRNHMSESGRPLTVNTKLGWANVS